jgi:hypothetical protein
VDFIAFELKTFRARRKRVEVRYGVMIQHPAIMLTAEAGQSHGGRVPTMEWKAPSGNPLVRSQSVVQELSGDGVAGFASARALG